MTAAQVLGVPLDASRADIDRAFRRLARSEHPDVAATTTDFARVTEARDVLVHAAALRTDAGPEPGVLSGQRRFHAPPVPPGPILVRRELIGFVALACGAAALAVWGSPSPLAPAEPIVRYLVLIASITAFARTGARGWLIAAGAAIVATAVSVLLWTTLGALVGTLIMAVPTVVLIMAGRATRARRGLQATTRDSEPPRAA